MSSIYTPERESNQNYYTKPESNKRYASKRTIREKLNNLGPDVFNGDLTINGNLTVLNSDPNQGVLTTNHVSILVDTTTQDQIIQYATSNDQAGNNKNCGILGKYSAAGDTRYPGLIFNPATAISYLVDTSSGFKPDITTAPEVLLANSGAFNAGAITCTTLSTTNGSAITFNGPITLIDTFSQTGIKTFSTGTGAISLNGPTTLIDTFSQAGNKTFSTGTGAISLNGDTTLTGNFSQTGNKTFSSGIGAISLNGPTTLIDTFSQTGNKTFSTGTGTVSLNGATNLTDNFSQTGNKTFSTGTGAISLNSATTLTGNFNQSGNTTFSTGTNTVSLNGPINANGVLTSTSTDSYGIRLPTAQTSSLAWGTGGGQLIGHAINSNDYISSSSVNDMCIRSDVDSKILIGDSANSLITIDTGAAQSISLNGNTTLATNKNFTLASGTGVIINNSTSPYGIRFTTANSAGLNWGGAASDDHLHGIGAVTSNVNDWVNGTTIGDFGIRVSDNKSMLFGAAGKKIMRLAHGTANDGTTAAFASTVALTSQDYKNPIDKQGITFSQQSTTINDTSSAGSLANLSINSFTGPTLTATNPTRIYTNATTVYIKGAPIASTGVSIGNAYALMVEGVTTMNNSLNITTTSNQIKLGSGSNITTLNAPISLGLVTLDLPIGSDTLVGCNTTNTLTNKTLITPVISTIVNGVASLTVPSTSNDVLVARNTTDTLTNKTLSSPIISTIVNGVANLTVPSTSNDVLVARNTTDTLTNKTLTSPVISTIVNGSANLTIPSTSNDTLVARNTTDTLTNKTLTAPKMSTIVNGAATLTLPTTTDTLVGLATSDNLLNKTLTDPSVSGLLSVNTTGTGPKISINLNNTDVGTTTSESRLVFSEGNNWYQGIAGKFNSSNPFLGFSCNTSSNTWKGVASVWNNGGMSIGTGNYTSAPLTNGLQVQGNITSTGGLTVTGSSDINVNSSSATNIGTGTATGAVIIGNTTNNTVSINGTNVNINTTGTNAINVGNTNSVINLNANTTVASGKTLTTPTLYLGTSGGTPSPLNYYEEYSESLVWKLDIYTVSVTVYYIRIGKMVTCRIPQFKISPGGGGGDTIFAGSGGEYKIPARFRPVSYSASSYPSIYFPIFVTANNVAQWDPGYFTIVIDSGSANNGAISIWKGINNDVFTGSVNGPVGDIYLNWMTS